MRYFLLKLAIDADDSWQQSLTRQLYAMELCYECGCKSPLLYLDAAQLYLRQEGTAPPDFAVHRSGAEICAERRHFKRGTVKNGPLILQRR